jgi:tRNA threonylcarbamoyladenosine biosynthesis protein TsaB
LLLGINTATPHMAMALVEDGILLGETIQEVSNAHSEAIFVHLETLMGWSGRTRADLKGLAVAVGPGGFTGLRTGLTLAKTLSQALRIPAYGIDTLEALATQFPGPGLVSAMLDARRELVFAGLYRVIGETTETVKAGALYPIAEWMAILNATEGTIACVGEGAMRHREALKAADARFWVPPDALMATRAVTVGLLGEKRIKAGLPDECDTLQPIYLREPQAVVNWEAAQQAKQAGK